MKILLVVLVLGLTGCASAPEIPAPPEKEAEVHETAPRADSPESPPLAYWRSRIVEAANSEWLYFGQQTVVIDGDEESIPHVGIWEDDDPEHSDRINQYWRAVGKHRLSGYDCREPWSAAFISWVMRTTGVATDLFPPSSAHRFYLNRILANANDPFAAFIPHTIQQYKAQAGDLICATRSSVESQEVMEKLPDSLNSRLHCDIVVETDGRTLQAIGGNVRNSVSRTVLTLSPEGYLQYSRPRPWFLIIENRLD